MTQSLLPNKIYVIEEKPRPLHHPDIIPGTPGNRASLEIHRSISKSYDLDIKAAIRYHERWSLVESDNLVLGSIYSELQRGGLPIMQLAYDVIEGSNSPLFFTALDLIGVRQRLGVESIRSPDDLLEGDVAKIPSKCFDILTSKKHLSKLFCNYGTCDVDSFLRFAQKHGKFDILGIPYGVSTRDLLNLLRLVDIDILDLSGYEGDRGMLNDIIKIVSRSSVKWVMLSEFITFRLNEIHLDWKNLNRNFKGFIGAREIGICTRSP
jgi:hypothetical protein